MYYIFIGDFLTFFSSDPLKLSLVGWRPSVDSHFHVFQKCESV